MKVSVQQFDKTDCGAACLASIARFYRLKLPVWAIREKAGTTRVGTSAYGLVSAAETLGFDAKGIEIDAKDLPEIPLPAIAHMELESGSHHFVVVYKVRKKGVKLMDPSDGRMINLPMERFLAQWTGVAILIIPSLKFEEGDGTVSNIRRFWDLLRPHKNIFIQSGVGAFVFSILGLSTAVYIQKLTDFVLVGHNRNLMHLMGIIMLVIILIQLVMGGLQSWFVLRVGQNIDNTLISGYFKHLIRLPQRFFDSMRVGELISRVNDAVRIRNFINQVAIESVVDVLIVVIAFVVMMIFNWRMALLAYSLVPLYFIVFLLTNSINKKLERKKMEATAELEINLVEALRSVKTIKQMGAESHFSDLVDIRLMKVLEQVYKSGKTDLFSNSGIHLANRMLTLLILWLGAGLVIDTHLTPGELMSFYAITAYFSGPVSRLAVINKSVHSAMVAVDRLFELLELNKETEDEGDIDLRKEDVGDIMFSDVTFSYTLEQDLFEKLNLTIKKGGISVLLGDSGSGKSTIAGLLQGLYKIQNGRINIGHHDMKHLTLSSVRKVVGVAPQNIELFAGDVIENIALGDKNPDKQRITEIIQQLGLQSTIDGLAEGLYTWLGENAIQLSGGQRQRLAIARMLYLDPQICIFDEATSFLDDRSEALIKNLILDLKAKGKTIIMVAHRMSTIDIADEVFVFANGKLIEAGQQKTLLNDKESRFYEMMQYHFANG